MSIDYNIMHRRFAHPLMDVLRHASGNLQGFPSILIPKENPICPGCALGKMTSSSFLATNKCATMPFNKVHMDLKAMPVRSYHGYNYIIIFFDDNTSHGWAVNLKNKSDADLAIRQFIAKIETQYSKQIHEFQINARGEFKSWELTDFLKELGVNILTSVLHMHQQNGHAQRFIRTHPSLLPTCPVLQWKSEVLNECYPENAMSYFPMDKNWTWATPLKNPPPLVVQANPHHKLLQLTDQATQ